MRKTIALAIALLLFGSVAEAGPWGKTKDFVKKHPKFSAAAASLVVGSIVMEKGTTRCRQGYLEVCGMGIGYGSERAYNGFTIGAGAALLFAGNKCSKDQPGWWFCDVLEFGVPAYQVAAGINDFKAYKPCDPGEAACGTSASKLTWKKK